METVRWATRAVGTLLMILTPWWIDRYGDFLMDGPLILVISPILTGLAVAWVSELFGAVLILGGFVPLVLIYQRLPYWLLLAPIWCVGVLYLACWHNSRP